MPYTDHVRIASAELLKAAELLKQEINDLRTKESRNEQDFHNSISDLMNEAKRLEVEMNRTDDSRQKSMCQTRMANIEKDIAQRKNDQDKMQQHIESDIKNKQRIITKLETQSRNMVY